MPNTIDILGDERMAASLIEGTLSEFVDDTVEEYYNRGILRQNSAITRIEMPNCRRYTGMNPSETAYDATNAFNNCQNLEVISFANLESFSAQGVCGSNPKLTTIYMPKATIIGHGNFQSCNMLVSVAFPATATISDSVLRNCKMLEYADCPKLTKLGGSTFNSCTKFSHINAPLLNNIVGQSTFYYCGLLSVSFPRLSRTNNNCFGNNKNLSFANLASARTIGSNTFYNCSNLQACIINTVGTTVATLSNSNAFYNTPSAIIYVPDSLVTSYQTATNWATYSSRIKGISELPSEFA